MLLAAHSASSCSNAARSTRELADLRPCGVIGNTRELSPGLGRSRASRSGGIAVCRNGFVEHLFGACMNIADVAINEHVDQVVAGGDLCLRACRSVGRSALDQQNPTEAGISAWLRLQCWIFRVPGPAEHQTHVIPTQERPGQVGLKVFELCLVARGSAALRMGKSERRRGLVVASRSPSEA